MQIDREWRATIIGRMDHIQDRFGLSPSTQGRYAFRNGHLYKRLTEGQAISVDTYLKYMEWSDKLIRDETLVEV